MSLAGQRKRIGEEGMDVMSEIASPGMQGGRVETY